MERPTLRQLEIFAEIVRAGTFRGAARALGLSQVAISDHVRQLERRLGCALFLRSAGGKPSLTRAGQTVLDHGRNVLFACDALIAAARSEAGEEGGSAEVATEISPVASPAPARTPAPPEAPAPEPEIKKEKPITIAGHPSILARFQDQLAAAEEAFPDRPITVDFAIFTAGAAHSALSKGLADIALFYSVGDTPDFPSDYLWSEQWSLLAKADHPLVQREALTRADCVDMPVVMLDPANPLRSLCEASLEKAGLWPSPTVLETDDYARIAAELDLGEAIFTAFGVSAAQFAARAGVKRLPLAEPLPSVEVRRAIGPGADDDPTIAALAGLLN